eukprot:87830_1
MAINRSACPYCAAEVAASNWHLHVKNCSVRTIQYYQWTKPISKESVNVKFWQCNKCQLHNYESAKQCVACGYAKDSAKLDSFLDETGGHVALLNNNYVCFNGNDPTAVTIPVPPHLTTLAFIRVSGIDHPPPMFITPHIKFGTPEIWTIIEKIWPGSDAVSTPNGYIRNKALFDCIERRVICFDETYC